MKNLIFILAAFTAIQANSQDVSLSWIEIEGNKIIVHYDLEDANPNHEYQVSLLSSKDKFAEPLKRVDGDIEEVRPGKNKKIIWDITRELGPFKGELILEIRARVYVPFVKLVKFDKGRIFKRGKNYPLTWTSGNFGGQVSIELYREDQRILGESNLPNTGKHDWYIPSNVKKGKNYHLRFTNSKNRNDYVKSATFTIRPKIPLLAKAAGVGLLGAAAIIVSGQPGPGPDDPIEEPLPIHPGKP